MLNTIHVGDSLQWLRSLPDSYVDCIVTSPPYYGLRDYGMPAQMGLEETPEIFIEKMMILFRECRRVLKNTGTLWVNMGDSYAANRSYQVPDGKYKEVGNSKGSKVPSGLKQKDLIGIPWMLAFALRSDGWYLRQDIIWSKPNPMPESVTDRCTKAHEYIFLLSKSAKYYYDHSAIMQDVSASSQQRLSQDVENQQGSDRVPGKLNGAMKARASWNGSSFDSGKTGEMKETRGHTRKSGNLERKKGIDRGCPEGTGSNVCGSVPWEGMKANKRSVWTVTTRPFKEAHFATFPEQLIVDCIKAGCPEGGIVLDPFMGAGTTALVARKFGRNYMGCELNPEYATIAEKRLREALGFFK